MSPTTCVSSQLTSAILKFRNPQGAEENWLENEQHIGNIYVHIPKVLLTEVACVALAVAAAVETVAYGTLFLSSLPVWLYSAKPLYHYGDLLNSSAFTMIWNFSNVVVINPFCKNAHTHESLARFGLDHWKRGNVVRTVLVCMEIAFWIFLEIVAESNSRSRVRISFIPTHLFFETIRYCRQKDYYYADFFYTQNIQRIGRENPDANILRGNFSLPSNIRHIADRSRETTREGAEFIERYLLSDNQVDATTKQLILEMDPDIFHFACTRAIFIYVFGERSGANPPPFFKPITNQHIYELRREFNANAGDPLENVLRSKEAYDRIDTEERSEPAEGDAGEPLRALLNRLKTVAAEEIQGSVFSTGCWQRACETYRQMHPQENPDA